jgi:glutamyl-tRNA synthetase
MRKGLSKDLIARVLGAAPKWTIAELEEKFPPRNLPDGAIVTRFAPSPTGLYHLGNLYQNIIAENVAHCTGGERPRGVFFLRIEDTDTKREVPGAVDTLVSSMQKFGFKVDEGTIAENTEVGDYGPYTQSERKDIYHSVVAELLADGRAYPCFLTPEEMEKIRAEQTAGSMPTGIYGEFARDRDLSADEIISRLDAGGMPSIRLYSTGDRNQKTFCKDAARGSIAFPQNDEDIVLIKSNDGLPTYHFAMLCDDHFMRTTHIVRAEEWLPSLPLHVQLFNMMEWDSPVFIHHATVDTLDAETGNRRKLSKRKDRVAAFKNLWEDGWAPEVFLEYIFNLIVSGYEEAKMKDPKLTVWEYPIKIKKLPTSGALFNMKKMEWWAREFIATLSVDELTRRVIDWAKEYSPEWTARIQGKEDYLKSMLAIERDPSSPYGCAAAGNPKRIRKDFVTWKQTLEETSYFWDDLFPFAGEGVARSAGVVEYKAVDHYPASLSIVTPSPAKGNLDPAILSEFLGSYVFKDGKDLWWNKITEIASKLGIKNGDAAMALRVALTGRTNTPDLYSIMQVMGENRVRERVENAMTRIKNGDEL